MIAIAYSLSDPASLNIAECLKSRYGVKEGDPVHLQELFLYKVPSALVHAESLDSLGADAIIFASKHSSASGVASMTVHSMGNFGAEAKLGGTPHSLSVAAPSLMLSVLEAMHKSGASVEKTYEATHHGPLLNTPSVFAEIGGNEDAVNNQGYAEDVAGAIYEAATCTINFKAKYHKVVIGIGGNHYPKKFTALALEKGYAFSHIISKYSLLNDFSSDLGMLEQAVQRSSERPETAVLEWKSLNSETRDRVVKKLDSMGMSHERV